MRLTSGDSAAAGAHGQARSSRARFGMSPASYPNRESGLCAFECAKGGVLDLAWIQATISRDFSVAHPRLHIRTHFRRLCPPPDDR